MTPAPGLAGESGGGLPLPLVVERGHARGVALRLRFEPLDPALLSGARQTATAWSARSAVVHTRTTRAEPAATRRATGKGSRVPARDRLAHAPHG